MEFKDKGPWIVVSETGHKIESDDFTHDVTLTISGDFVSDADRIEYAKGLCEILNRRWIPTTVEMPPSGVIVLAYYKTEYGISRRIRACWIKAKSVESETDSSSGEYDEATDAYYDPEGWYEQLDNCDDYGSFFVSRNITHWMPLPDVPNI